MIVLGPGSLYTSIMPNLLTEGVAAAVAASDAFKVYVLNVMTQDGETEGYTASDHIGALFSNSGERLFDWCLANDRPIPERLLERYGAEGAEPVRVDEEAVSALGVGLLRAPWRLGLGLCAARARRTWPGSCCGSTARNPTRGSTAERPGRKGGGKR